MVHAPTVENHAFSVPEDGLDDVEFAKYQKDHGLLEFSQHKMSCVPEDGLDDVEFAKYLGDCGLLRRSLSLPISLATRVSSFMEKLRSKCSLVQSTMTPSAELSDDTDFVDYVETGCSILHNVSSDYEDIRNIITGGTEDGWYPFSWSEHSAAPFSRTVFVSTPRILMGSPSILAMPTCSMSVPSSGVGATRVLASTTSSSTRRSEVLDAGDRPIHPIVERTRPHISATPVSPPAEREPMDTSEKSTPKTTLMLCNIPVHYSRAMVMDMLKTEGFEDHVEFIYIPMNLRKLSNFGYAFVNLDSPQIAVQCREKLHDFNRWNEPSEKRMRVEWSDSQGLEANIERYRNSPIMHESVPEDLKPALFKRGAQVDFPEPTKAIRAPRLRKSGDQGHQDNCHRMQ